VAQPLILVIGATGPTGSEAVRQLLLRGERARAVTRDRAKAEAMPALEGAEIVVGSSSQPESLRDAFDGVRAVYLVPPTDLGWDRMQSGLIENARRAGVEHIVKISAIGAGPDQPSMSLTFHWRGEQEIAASGIRFTHLRGNSFSQNTLFDAETIKREGRFYSCVGDARFAKVDTRDIGEVVATVLTERGHEGKTYELTGPEALTYSGLAAVLSAVLGREIEYVDLRPDDYAALLTEAGFPAGLGKEFADIYGRGFYREGRGAYTTADVDAVLGRPPRRYEDFARDYADALR
jgi:uncharacterized protein YbjT (DUF2867 family)